LRNRHTCINLHKWSYTTDWINPKYTLTNVVWVDVVRAWSSSNQVKMFMQIVQSKKTSSTVYLLNINHVTKLFLSHVNHVRRVFHFHLKTNKTLEVATKPLKNFKKWQTTPNWRFFSSYKVSGLDYVVWSIHCAEDTKSEYNRFVISCFQEQKW
jgi:hypothetical protein